MRASHFLATIVAGTFIGLTGCQSGLPGKMAFWRWGRSTENEVKLADAGATDSLAKPSSSAVPQMASGAYATVPPGASPPAANPSGGALTASNSSNPYAGLTAGYGQQASFTTPEGSEANTRPDSRYPVTSANPGQVHTAGVTTRTEVYPNPSSGQYPQTNAPYGVVQPQVGPYPSTAPGTETSGSAYESTRADNGSYGYGATTASSRRTATGWGQDTSSSIPGYPPAYANPTPEAYQASQGNPSHGATENVGANGHYAPTEYAGWGDSAQGAMQAPPPRPWNQEPQAPPAGWSGPSVDTSAVYAEHPSSYAATMPNTPNYAGGGTPGVTPNPPGRGSAESPSTGTHPGSAADQSSPPATEIPASRTSEPYRPGSTSTYNPTVPASLAVGSTTGRLGSPPPGAGGYPSTDGSSLIQANYNQPTPPPAAGGATSGYPSTGYSSPAWSTAASHPY